MRALILAILLVVPSAARGFNTESRGATWPNGTSFRTLSDIGEGVAVVFSPDLAPVGNRLLYQRLGFLYFENPDWRSVLDLLAAHNRQHPDSAITTLLLETHGTNGNGLKLQLGKDPEDQRSYISAGALEEELDRLGIATAFMSACNAGRLFRPEIYRALNRDPGDALFLPATIGIIDSSDRFDPEGSRVRVFRRRQSNLETLVHGRIDELSAPGQAAFASDRESVLQPFAVSTMLVQLLTGDPSLELTSAGHTEIRSRADLTPQESERLFETFLKLVDQLAARETTTAVAGLSTAP